MTTQQETVEQFKGIFPAGSTIFPVVYWQDPSRPEIQRICFYAWRPGDHPRSITFITKYIAQMLKHPLDTTDDACLYMYLGENAGSIINQIGLVCYQDETAYLMIEPIKHFIGKIETPLELLRQLQRWTTPTNTAILTRITSKWEEEGLYVYRTINFLAMTQRGGHFELHDVSVFGAYALDKPYKPHKGIVLAGTGYNHALETTKELGKFIWGDEAFYQCDL